MKPCVLLLFCMVLVEGTTVQKALHDGNNQFTAKLFSEVVKTNQDKSIVFSAFSVITPLSQLAAGSVGESHDELINAVGFPSDVELCFLNINYHSLRWKKTSQGKKGSTAALSMCDERLVKDIFTLIDEKFNTTKGVELKKASKFYVQEGYEVQDEFAVESRDIYHSEIANIDFNDSKNSAKEINTWVENETNQRIKDLVDPSSITPKTRGVLVNALYFKGSWKYPFNKFVTKEKTFYVNNENTLQIPTMHNTKNYNYKQSSRLNSKILELPYDGDQSSFLVVLPNEVEGIGQLLEDLKDLNILDEETSRMSKYEVRVSIPKFKIETTTNLKEVLMNMHVMKIFGESANLTKLLKTDDKLYVSDAVQKAFIEVNEQGAEAAAANAFYINRITSLNAPPLSFDFIADHPFVFFLKVNGEIFFSGVYFGQ